MPSDDHLLIKPPPPPEQIESRPHPTRVRLDVVATLIALLAAVFSFLQWRADDAQVQVARDALKMAIKTAEDQANDVERARKAAEESAMAAKELAAATKRSVEVSSLTATLAEDYMRGRIAIERIYLQRPIVIGQGIDVVVETKNVGHATAVQRSYSRSQRWRSLPIGPMPAELPSKAESSAAEPGSETTLLVMDRTPVSPEFMEELEKGTTSVYFFGRILYETLGKKHFTEFCAHLMPLNTASLPKTASTAPATVDPRFVLRQCNKWHNVE